MFEKLQEDNTIVGYVNGRAIAVNESGNVFYCTMPQEFVTIGETMLAEDMRPVSELHESIQQAIHDIIDD